MFPNQIPLARAVFSLSFCGLQLKNKIGMRSAKAVYQFFAFLALSAFIQSAECHAASHDYVRSVNLSAPETFVGSVFDEFGSNNSMNSQQFNLLLGELNIGSSSNEQASENGKSKVRANLMSMLVFFFILLFYYFILAVIL